MKIKLTSNSILTEAEISANIQQLIDNKDFANAYKQASSKVDNTNEKLFELRMTYSPNDKKKTDSAASLQAFTSKYLVMKDENGKPISTRTRNTPGGDSFVGKTLSKLFGFGKITSETFSQYFTVSDNEEDAFVTTEDNINKIIKQLEKGFGKDIQLVKLQARPGEVSNEKDRVIDEFLKSNDIDTSRVKDYRKIFIDDCVQLGFDEVSNPLLYWVKHFAQNLNLTDDKYIIIRNLYIDNILTKEDLINKNKDSFVYNKTLYSNTWVNIEWFIEAYKQALSDLDINTLLDSSSTEDKPVAYKGTVAQFRNEALFGKKDANPSVDVLHNRKDVAEFTTKYISSEGISKANSKVTKKSREKEDDTTSQETSKSQQSTNTRKEVQDAERWKKILQDTNNTNLSKKEIDDFKRYLTSVVGKKLV